MNALAREAEELGRIQAWMYNFRLPDGATTCSTGSDHYSGTHRDSKCRVLQSLNVAGKRVLDMGCSEGLYSFYLAEKGANVLGVDIDKKRIEKAKFMKRVLSIKNVEFEYGNVLNPEYRKTLPQFDLVLAWGLLHRVPDPFNALYAIGTISQALALEWMALAIPFGSRLSLASHPPEKTFEWKNIGGIKKEDIKEDSKGTQSNRTPFWIMTSGAVKAIILRLGYTHFLYPRENALQRSIRCLRSFTTFAYSSINPRMSRAAAPTIRLHMICEKNNGNSIYSGNYSSRIQIAPWDAN